MVVVVLVVAAVVADVGQWRLVIAGKEGGVGGYTPHAHLISPRKLFF